MAASLQYSRLIITAPAEGNSFDKYWVKIFKPFRRYVPIRGSNDIYGDFLSSGLPYHLPFSFPKDHAESFAAELVAVGCQVKIVDSE